jgi:CheY-like chemotaxis protein
MPGMDGYQVFETLRADSGTCDIPVIFVTGMDGADWELRGLELGAVDYITKPIVPPILLTARAPGGCGIRADQHLLRRTVPLLARGR